MATLMASYHVDNRPEDTVQLVKLDASSVLSMNSEHNGTFNVYFRETHLQTLEDACAHLREIIAAKAKAGADE